MGASKAAQRFFVLGGLFAAFFIPLIEGSSEPWLKSEKHAERGSSVELPCVLKLPQCGGLHSIKWYRGAIRIFIFSEGVGLTRGTSDLAIRSNMSYETNATKSFLKIPDLKLEDEGLYKCEATYLAVNRECNNVQHITLTVTVKPDKLVVTNEETKEVIADGSTLTPVNEGTRLVLNCESGVGKPVPVIEWFNGTQIMRADNSSSTAQGESIGAGKSRLEVVVTRGDLGARFTCKASSPALPEPLSVGTNVIVNVRPLGMDLGGVVNHVVQGSKVMLQCQVKGARPAANVTWYNGTEPILNDDGETNILHAPPKENVDGTWETESSLVFRATQYENEVTFGCHAENIVTRQESVKPMKETITLEVYYPPIVTVSPENVTVNESQDIRLFCAYIANPATLLKAKWLKDGVEVNLNDDRFEGGITEQTTLLIRNATPTDMGMYSCVLENSVGESNSQDVIDVSVLFRPVVEVSLEPQTPVNEADRLNVSLTCDVQSGNPGVLTAVRWYLDGDLLKELPDCVSNSTPATIADESSTFCDIDPSKLLLEVVGRSFHGKYSCEGRNDAGWGPISASIPVVVYYKPGPASISYEPQQVVKKGRLKITCSVLDAGRPEVTGYKWTRGQHRLPDENKPVLNIEPVDLETQANFTCLAYNEAGDGDAATIFIEVSAPPAFIKKLPPYQGFVYNAANVSIDCRVECVPLCSISWFKDNVSMDFTNNNHYYLSNTIHPPDPRTNDFQSIRSELVWNLTSWPNGELDRNTDNGKFTCKSSGNSIGPGVISTTHFHVEFPPENINTSKSVVDVVVDHIPETVLCTVKAHPEPSFQWYKEGSSEVISFGSSLVFDVPMPRRSTGRYICEAYNRHGSQRATMSINVQFKPDCRIDKQRINGDDYLVCSAVANPEKVDYVWSLKNENDTLEQISEEREDKKSYLFLNPAITNFRTYQCVANNTIGSSVACEFNMAARDGNDSNLPWYQRLDGDLLLIVIIVAVAILLAIVIICVVIFLICRRKRNQAKHNNRVVEMEERDHPDGGSPSPAGSVMPPHPTPAPRWPLKPGVLVHINRSHSLRSGLRTHLDLQSRVSASRSAVVAATSCFRNEPERRSVLREVGPVHTVARTPVRAYRRAKNTRRALSMSNVNEDGMLARANRIRAMFGAQFRDNCTDTFPGISRDKTAVTYKRIVPRKGDSCERVPSLLLHPQLRLEKESQHRQRQGAPGTTGSNYDANVSRKRKKPGADPTQAANNNHVDSVSEGLPEPETKTFYENLPFHGIQTPPNKLISPKFARVSALHGGLNSGTSSPSSSRPPSRTASRPTSRATSLCGGSSGYGSTRSHLGPHYSPNNMPRSNSPELKYNSLKPRRRKHKHAQFYSLRLCRRHQTTHHNYQLYAVPIRKSCPHNKESGTNGPTCDDNEERNRGGTSTIDARSNEQDETAVLKVPKNSPPIPAPRTRRVTDPSQHTYQNVPSPIFPENNNNSCHGSTTKNMIKTANLYNYQEHYQQHQQELQQYGYPMASGSSNQLTLPLTRSLHPSSGVGPNPMQTTTITSNCSSNNAVQLNHRHSLPRALVHGDMEMDLVHDNQPRQQQQSGGRRNERRKYRKHGNERKPKKQQQHRQDLRRTEPPYTFSRETSFNQNHQELRGVGGGIRENTYKISYPHYYEDSITECPLGYPSYEGVPGEQQREREVVDSPTDRNSRTWTTPT
ncbi:titin isoform X2 [Athalia rosae]|uniref:titin isoform X2 n=1 Tax=Athalia rosae TaxID=37344 RepID=UPI0020338CAE|nr:titin isoform X2 [Athalia rosae]